MVGASLVYVMGPSGAGKTRVIDYARRKIDGRLPVAFAHRYITRPLGKDDENYIVLSKREFALRKARGLFVFDWEAYGFEYGIGVEIKTWLGAGLTVIMDGSRAHFIGTKPAIANLVPVLVTVGRDELRRRLTAREREDAKAIEERLARAGEFATADLALVTIDNSGPIERAGEAFAAIVTAQATGS
jgi:ribose 1,5-bisphosphokinase